MRSNYGGQGCDSLHALVGLVSIAGGFASRCFAVRGGNQQVPVGLLSSAQPERLLLRTTARAVRRAGSGSRQWEVLVEPDAPGEAMKGNGTPGARGELRSEGPFDLVAVAHPLERSSLRFEGLPAAPLPKGGFRRCVTHFVQGSLRRGLFTAATRSPPMAVLTVSWSSAPFYSIGLQMPVDLEGSREGRGMLDAALRGMPAIFKVFAPNELSEAQLDDIFEERQGPPKVLDWYAYPEYTVPQVLTPFLLDAEEGSLIYLNAIEQAASAMEMSAVSARNAANLAVRFVERRRGAGEQGEGF